MQTAATLTTGLAGLATVAVLISLGHGAVVAQRLAGTSHDGCEGEGGRIAAARQPQRM